MNLDYRVKEKMTMPSFSRKKEKFEIIAGESPLETVAWFVGIEYAFRKILPTRVGRGALGAYNKLIGVPTEKIIDGFARGVKRTASGPLKAVDKRIPGYAARQTKRAARAASKQAKRAAKAAARETNELRALGRKGYVVTEKVAQKGTTAAVEAQQTIGRLGGKAKGGVIRVGKQITGGTKKLGGKIKGFFKPKSSGKLSIGGERAPGGGGLRTGARVGGTAGKAAGLVGTVLPAVATVGLMF